MTRLTTLSCMALMVVACGDDNDGGLAGTDATPSADAAPPADCSDAEELPARIQDDLMVGPGCVILNETQIEAEATVTFAPGTTVSVKAGGYLRTSPFDDGATVVAVGSSNAPILFTSNASTPAAGDWGCLYLGTDGDATEFEHVIVEHAGAPCGASGNGYETGVLIAGPMKTFRNVTVRDSSGNGVRILVDAAIRDFSVNTFSRNELASIQVNQNQVTSVGSGNSFEAADDFIQIETSSGSKRTGTWTKQAVPWRINGHMQIGSEDNEVTIEPGTTIQLDSESLEVFMANLIAVGTAAEPITFTSAQASPAAGDWGCIYFSASVGTPRFENVVFEYGGSGAGCTGANHKTALIVPGAAKVTGNTFKDMAGRAIRTTDPCPTGADDFCMNTFTNLAEALELACGVGGTPTDC